MHVGYHYQTEGFGDKCKSNTDYNKQILQLIFQVTAQNIHINYK